MIVVTKDDVFSLLRDFQEEIGELGVKRLGLFGSFVRNEQDTESDIDIVVEFESGRKSFDSFMKLAFLLEELSGRKVELVTKESLSPYIAPYILNELEYVEFSPPLSSPYPD